jgi:hypothetical protein
LELQKVSCHSLCHVSVSPCFSVDLFLLWFLMLFFSFPLCSVVSPLLSSFIHKVTQRKLLFYDLASPSWWLLIFVILEKLNRNKQLLPSRNFVACTKHLFFFWIKNTKLGQTEILLRKLTPRNWWNLLFHHINMKMYSILETYMNSSLIFLNC